MSAGIEVRNVSKSFGGNHALDHCSVKIKEGTITSIIGPNGAGKTTLFNIISGIEREDQGKVLLKGRDISSLPAHKRALLGLARTFQQARVFTGLSVLENLMIDRPRDEKAVKDSLKRVGFHADAKILASDLSYGQARLVELARVLHGDAHTILLDEPTAGINPMIRRSLKGILRAARDEGKTVMLVEHDMEFVMDISDEVVVMAQGSVLAQGPPSRIQKDKRVLEAYLGR